MWLPREPPRAALFLHDGQNAFAAGARRPAWNIEVVAEALIERDLIVPLAIVAIHAARGTRRWREYLPYPDPRNRRARRFEADAYADLVVDTVIPRMEAAHPELRGVEHVGIGGASYGAVAALHTALRHPRAFDRLLLESPPLWVGEGRLIDNAGRSNLPRRISIGVGGRESRREDVSAELVRLARAFARTARARGAEVRISVDPDAPHHESAWAARARRALMWLFAGPKPR